MGLLDKVKAQAAVATEMAKDAAQKGQAKLGDMQANKSADGLLRDLGAAFYATKTGRSTPTTDSDIDQLIAAIHAHEAEHGALVLAPASAAVAPTAAPAGAASQPYTPPPASGPPTVVNQSSTPPDMTAAPTGVPAPPPAAADPTSPPPPPPTAQTI
ncbi:MAG TPA: hypothetical protein VHV57_05305 [Acidimicrobiales bacterium]|jgi:hypothetical protein|nr:hypothetical protein [Acidimicrobiales bacterium]